MRSRFLLTPEQHRARAALLRQLNPNSRAAELSEVATRVQESAAQKRRAGVIAQLHQQAIIALDDMSAWQQAIKARVAKDARRREVATWMFAAGAFVLLLGCVLALPRL
jgi:acyl transferase domain-containing protein